MVILLPRLAVKCVMSLILTILYTSHFNNHYIQEVSVSNVTNFIIITIIQNDHTLGEIALGNLNY